LGFHAGNQGRLAPCRSSGQWVKAANDLRSMLFCNGSTSCRSRSRLVHLSRARRPPRTDDWRKACRGSSGLAGFARAALRALRQAPGQGLLDRARSLSHERLFRPAAKSQPSPPGRIRRVEFYPSLKLAWSSSGPLAGFYFGVDTRPLTAAQTGVVRNPVRKLTFARADPSPQLRPGPVRTRTSSAAP
jgi:hypothetical protein